MPPVRRRRSRPSPALLAAALVSAVVAPLGACAGEPDPEEEARRARALPAGPAVGNVELERPAFRLRRPESWRVGREPGGDPERSVLLEGPGGATIALLVSDAPADPAALVEAMASRHGLDDERRSAFERWGRYEGTGVELRGEGEDGERAGMRVFGWSSDARSFLVAERYTEEGYPLDRAGIEVVELSFRVAGEGEPRWPDVAHGTPTGDGESAIVRPGLRLRFPDGWSVDVRAEGYDPDGAFTLRSPWPGSFVAFRLLEGRVKARRVLDEALPGARALLDEVGEESRFDRWGRLEGAGVALEGSRGGLPASLRVFVHPAAERTLVVTELWFEEVAERVRPGLRRIASSFELR